jgi:hypothetical protein
LGILPGGNVPPVIWAIAFDVVNLIGSIRPAAPMSPAFNTCRRLHAMVQLPPLFFGLFMPGLLFPALYPAGPNWLLVGSFASPPSAFTTNAMTIRELQVQEILVCASMLERQPLRSGQGRLVGCRHSCSAVGMFFKYCF